MKILHVLAYFHPAVAFGGPVQQSLAITHELAKRKNKVVVYTTDAKSFGTRMDMESVQYVNGVRVHYFTHVFPRITKATKFLITPGLVMHARKEIESFDIIHIHELRTFQSLVCYHFAKKVKVPYCLQTHGSLPLMEAKIKQKWIFDKLFGDDIVENASKLIALNRIEANQFEKRGVPRPKIKILPNGIDLSPFQKLPSGDLFKSRFHIEENQKIILFIGRLHKIKSIDVLIKAFHKVLTNYKDPTVLVIVGPDEGELRTLKLLVNGLGLNSKVIFTGPLYGSEKIEALVSAEMVVLPSRYEAFPAVILEAYACNKPVIASNIEALPDIVLNEKSGLLFPSGNEEELAKAIMVLLRKPDLTQRMGLFARRLVERKYSIGRVADILEELYQDIIN